MTTYEVRFGGPRATPWFVWKRETPTRGFVVSPYFATEVEAQAWIDERRETPESIPSLSVPWQR